MVTAKALLSLPKMCSHYRNMGWFVKNKVYWIINYDVMIVFDSMYIQTNESLAVKSVWSTCLPFTKKEWIQNTTNLINYTWNIVKNVIVIVFP